jgi:hypothetical protein
VQFSHAAVHTAEVVKTQTLRGPLAAAAFAAAAGENSPQSTSAPEQYHTAELSGCFFPSQVRRLLELFRVPLPSFTCRLYAEEKQNTGINVFSRLGMFRVQGVRCDSRAPSSAVAGAAEGAREWHWEFELAGG